jgi:hypothetical protein
MPKGDFYRTELEAVKIVREAEEAKGWRPEPRLSVARERVEGCDFFSKPPRGGGPAHPIEVKGRGGSIFTATGALRPDVIDVNVDQLNRAKRDRNV